MRWSLLGALLLSAPALAGCIGDANDDIDTTGNPVIPSAVPGVQRFLADGTVLPVDDVVGSPAYHLSGHPGAEPNIGITKSGAMFVTAGEETLKSTDGGVTWETSYTFPVVDLPVPFVAVRSYDPMLWVDPVTDRVFTDHMYPGLVCNSVIFSDDEGATWTERHGACGLPVLDHQKLVSGPPGPDAPPLAGAAYETVVYLCYNKLLSTNCAVSYDGGLNFPIDRVVANGFTDGCGGINGHPLVRADGVVVVPMTLGCGGLFLGVSTDSGLTWTVAPGPSDVGGTSIDPDITFGPDGTLYALWQGEDNLAYMARTPDLGATWAGPFLVTPPGVKSTSFSVLNAGDQGRLAMSFLGTRDTDAYPSEAEDDARWHLFVVTTEDADAENPTFTSFQVTPDEDPVQIGCVWLEGGGEPCRNMLDFIDSAVHPDGTFYVVYTEGCTEDCAGNPDAAGDESRDSQIAVAGLHGWPLVSGEEMMAHEHGGPLPELLVDL